MQLPTTKAHCAENLERCYELAQPPERCTICMEAFADGGPAGSPLLGDRASRHWACTECWVNINDDDNWRCPRCRGRDPIERWRKKRLCQEAWKQRHRGSYLAQKRELARRPEYLAKRRALYAQKRAAKRPSTGDSA